MIHCEKLTKFYGNQKVIDDLSFDLHEGEILGFLGVNGAGKTTTIKLILGLIKLDGGTIKKSENLKIGYSPETPYFHNFLTAKEVMKYYGKIQKIPKKNLEDEIVSCLDLVGLSEYKDRKVKFFSKGMLQRLAVAQSLLGNPSVVILDEPCAGLDAIGRIKIREMMLRLKEEGKTVLLNSHILSDVQSISDRVIIINKGKKIEEIQMQGHEHSGQLEELFVSAVGDAL